MQRRARTMPPPHFTPVARLGYPDGVRCWCGTSLTFVLHEKEQEKKRLAFMAEHEECACASMTPEPSPDRKLAQAYGEVARTLTGKK